MVNMKQSHDMEHELRQSPQFLSRTLAQQSLQNPAVLSRALPQQSTQALSRTLLSGQPTSGGALRQQYAIVRPQHTTNPRSAAAADVENE